MNLFIKKERKGKKNKVYSFERGKQFKNQIPLVKTLQKIESAQQKRKKYNSLIKRRKKAHPQTRRNEEGYLEGIGGVVEDVGPIATPTTPDQGDTKVLRRGSSPKEAHLG